MSNQVYQIYHIIKCARFSKTYLPHTHIYGLLVYVSRTSFVNVGIRLVLFTPESPLSLFSQRNVKKSIHICLMGI